MSNFADSRITAYARPAQDGSDNVEVEVEAMMVDLVTFIKAAAINHVVPEATAKAKFLSAIEEVWNNVEVTMEGQRQ